VVDGDVGVAPVAAHRREAVALAGDLAVADVLVAGILEPVDGVVVAAAGRVDVHLVKVAAEGEHSRVVDPRGVGEVGLVVGDLDLVRSVGVVAILARR